jgi:hypothetical protein
MGVIAKVAGKEETYNNEFEIPQVGGASREKSR